MKAIKIGVIGSGSTYNPELIEGLLKRRDELPVAEIALMDIDPERLEITGALAERMVKKAGVNTRVIKTLDRKKVMDGADFVVTQIRVGLMEGRARDERIPLEFGVIGQETTGPGGFSMALRTIPVMLEIGREMEKLSPDGWMINFTNPSGLVTEALNHHTRMRMIGLCNSPITLQNRLATLFNVTVDRIWMDYFGLNHLSFISKVFLDGDDVTKEALERISQGDARELPGYAFNPTMLKALGMIPNGYLQFFYHKDKLLEKLMSSPGRAETVKKIDKELLELYKDPNLNEKPKILEQRGGAWYSDAACALISAMINDKKEVHIVNVKNHGAIGGLGAEDVVEVPALIKRSGAYPLVMGEMPLSVRSLIQTVKTYELLTVKAAVEGSREAAILALVNHPLVPTVDIAENLFNRILEENRDWLPQFRA